MVVVVAGLLLLLLLLLLPLLLLLLAVPFHCLCLTRGAQRHPLQPPLLSPLPPSVGAAAEWQGSEEAKK